MELHLIKVKDKYAVFERSKGGGLVRKYPKRGGCSLDRVMRFIDEYKKATNENTTTERDGEKTIKSA